MKNYIILTISVSGLLSVTGCSTLSSLFGISVGILFLIWIVPSLIPALIASNKGRSPLGLFLLSIFFTPIVGLIVALIIAPISKTETHEQKEHSGNDAIQSQPIPYSTTFKKDEPIDKITLYWSIAVIVFIIIVIFYSAR